jgi:hypothetical protein
MEPVRVGRAIFVEPARFFGGSKIQKPCVNPRGMNICYAPMKTRAKQQSCIGSMMEVFQPQDQLWFIRSDGRKNGTVEPRVGEIERKLNSLVLSRRKKA